MSDVYKVVSNASDEIRLENLFDYGGLKHHLFLHKDKRALFVCFNQATGEYHLLTVDFLIFHTYESAQVLAENLESSFIKDGWTIEASKHKHAAALFERVIEWKNIIVMEEKCQK